MRILRNNLIIAFALIQPEIFIEGIKTKPGEMPHFTHCIPDKKTYSHYALEYFHGRTYEEIDSLYEDMRSTIRSRGKMCGGEEIFALIPEYTLSVLLTNSDVPLCKQDQKLNWRSCYLHLGQDLLTTAHAAYISVTENRDIRHFDWSAIIGTDDRRLSDLLKNGLAENHFHLNGSARGFDLSWLCFMNHPGRITEFFKDNNGDYYKNFRENLNTGISLGTSDNRYEWKRKILLACWLRVRLFLWLQTGKFEYGSSEDSAYKSLINATDHTTDLSGRKVANLVSEAKYLYGRCGRVRQPDGHLRYLDYAITADIACNESCCRVLVGERAFMYRAFRLIYSGSCETAEMHCFREYFYLYLLIKNQFRRELVQVNGRYGFKNFALYQDRKDIIFENFPKYALEAYNLSVRDGIENGNVSSLEMRISSKNTYTKLRNSIVSADDGILYLQTNKKLHSSFERKKQGFDSKYFYVIHFPKLPEKKSLPKHKERVFSFINAPRNNEMRRRTKIQALAIALSLRKCNWLCSRIRGIDACTFEIACRPEVFATEFRFLRDHVFTDITKKNDPIINILQPKISATYHVGEDFMDIIDGLRAIDEAVLFLEMKPGERLGHAIAMGTDVHRYYLLKNKQLVLKKQDILDNIVWAVNKAKAFNINLSSAFKQKMYDKAAGLIYEIYGHEFDICDYFRSWRLRGDDPELYRFGAYDEEKYNSLLFMGTNNITAQYNKRMIADHYHPDALEHIRKNSEAAKLYSMYHFDYSVREKGEEYEKFFVTDGYIETAQALQSHMKNEIASKRISIECNPSSNVLIGPFELYDQHHIFTFQPVVRRDGEVCQFVSVNTDDQGVFDTSLEEEYALLECALGKQKKPDNSPVYSDIEIYDYLERLRRNGFAQIFPKTK